MFRCLLIAWLSGQVLVSAGTVRFTEAEMVLVNSTARLETLPAALERRVADNTLAWMTETSSHVLACWTEVGSRAGLIADPSPSPALLRHARETCATAARTLASDSGPSPRTADMAPAVGEFLHASRAAVDAAVVALADGAGDTARANAIAQFNSYSRSLETGRLPVWMLQAATESRPEPRLARMA